MLLVLLALSVALFAFQISCQAPFWNTTVAPVLGQFCDYPFDGCLVTAEAAVIVFPWTAEYVFPVTADIVEIDPSQTATITSISSASIDNAEESSRISEYLATEVFTALNITAGPQPVIPSSFSSAIGSTYYNLTTSNGAMEFVSWAIYTLYSGSTICQVSNLYFSQRNPWNATSGISMPPNCTSGIGYVPTAQSAVEYLTTISVEHIRPPPQLEPVDSFPAVSAQSSASPTPTEPASPGSTVQPNTPTATVQPTPPSQASSQLPSQSTYNPAPQPSPPRNPQSTPDSEPSDSASPSIPVVQSPSNTPAAPSPDSRPTTLTLNSIPLVLSSTHLEISTYPVLPGSAPVSWSDLPVSLDASATALIIGSSTYPIQTSASSPDSPAPAEQTAPTLRLGSSIYTEISATVIVVEGQTLAPGGTVITLDGATVSLESGGGVVAVGTSLETMETPVPSATEAPAATLRLGSDVYTEDSASIMVIDGQTLAPGRTAITVEGMTVSLEGGGGVVAVGTSLETIETPATSAAATTTDQPDVGGLIWSALNGDGGGGGATASGSGVAVFTGAAGKMRWNLDWRILLGAIGFGTGIALW